MSSLLVPISQMTRGQHVFGACMIARSLYSVIKAGVNAYKTSACDNRIRYVALACLEALNAGFKSIVFLGYVTGNIPLMALSSVLTVIFLAIIAKVERKIKSEETLIQCGKDIYYTISRGINVNSDYSDTIYNNDFTLLCFLSNLNHHDGFKINIKSDPRENLRTLYELRLKFPRGAVSSKTTPNDDFSDEYYVRLYKGIKALEEKYPMDVPQPEE